MRRRIATNLADPEQLERYLNERTVLDPNGCRVWQRSVQGGGYPSIISPWGPRISVHRLVYILRIGPISDALEVHHKCGNRRCCNPEHLQALSDIGHKRADPNWVGNRTHCKRGHPLSGDNLSPAMLRRGIRRCKACVALKMREARAADPDHRAKNAAAMREWREKNRDKWNDYQRERRQRLKGLPVDPTP